MASRAAAIFDLDRTLIASSSAPVFQRHLSEAGVGTVHDIPLADAYLKFYERFGESWVMMQPARLGSRTAKGWSVDAVARGAAAAAAELETMVPPYARQLIREHQAAGRALVLATTSPHPWVSPLAERLGFDAVVATRWVDEGGTYTGETDGAFVWGRAKADAVAAWAADNGISMRKSHGYSDSYFDAPLLDAVGHPTAVNPDLRLQGLALLKGWPVRHFDSMEGIVKVGGVELQELGRPFMREEFQLSARFEFDGIHNIPETGPAIVVFNHRSYFDSAAVGLLAGKAGRNVRSLGKKEVFALPLVGGLIRAIGGIPVDRGTGSDEPLEKAADAVRAGELLMMAPQGTIPRGPAFFEPELKGRWGAARLAAMTQAPVIPVGLWGTEHVWPRSSRLPKVFLNPADRPLVSVNVGPPVPLSHDDPDLDTKAIMSALVDLLPSEAKERRTPTHDVLMRTFPPGYDGDPEAESDRRPGTDTKKA